MKKTVAILLTLALILTAAAPALAADEPGGPIGTDDVTTEGPETIREGEVIAVRVLVTSENHGVSARVESAGLELLTRIGGAISKDPEHRFLLEAGEPGAVFFFRVTGAPGEEASVDPHDVHILEDGTDRMGTSAGWAAEIQEGSASAGPLTYAEARAAVGVEDDDDYTAVDAFADGAQGISWSAYLPALEEDGALALAFGGADLTLFTEEELASEAVATGQAYGVFASDLDPETFAEIVVPGDVLGTGEFNISQLVRLAQAINGSDPLTGPFLEAGKVAGGEDLSIADLVAAARLLSSD